MTQATDTTSSSPRRSLTVGADYTRAEAVKPYRLAIPAQGLTKHEAETQIHHYQRMGNAWDAVGAEFEAQGKMHNAHTKMFNAATAQINASTAYIGTKTAWNNNQVAVSSEKISANAARTAIASVPIEIQRQNIELEKKRENLTKATTEYESLLVSNQQKRQDLTHETVMARLDGYKIDTTIPVVISQNLSGLLNS